MSNFYAHEKYMQMSREARLSLNPSMSCSFGLDCLDHHLKFIHPTEIILVGCESGKGKTTFVSNLIMTNAKKGKRVAFFKLEGDICEFVDTEKWKIIYRLAKERGSYPKNFTYIDYRYNNIKGIEDVECQAEIELKPIMKNIFLYSKEQNLNTKNLPDMISEISSKVDLIAIDHLHYFDMLSNSDKYQEEKQIMKICNSVADKLRVPIIIVSHLRKKQGKDEGRLPGLDDFMGSSDIPKISHTSIVIAPDYGRQDNENSIYSTLVYCPKNRSGASTTQVFIKNFDGKSKEYIPGYDRVNYTKNTDGKWKCTSTHSDLSKTKLVKNNF